MSNQQIIPQIISLIVTILIITLLIFLLPSILILTGVIIVLSIIAGIIFKFMGGEEKMKMSFIYVKREAQNSEENPIEIHEMKDVTNSSKPIE